jgi:hypothetical protein
MLTVDTKKRIKLEEIKTHSVYKKGEALLKKDERANLDPIKVNEFVIELMTETGLSKEELLKNLKEKKYNNLTTTFNLLVSKYINNPNLMDKIEEEKKKVELSKQLVEEKTKNIVTSNNTNNCQVPHKSKQTFFLSQMGSNNNSVLDSCK